MKKGLLLAASFAMMGSMGSAHAMQPMTGDEMRDVAGQGYILTIKLQNPVYVSNVTAPEVRIRDFFPYFKLGFHWPVKINKV